MALFTFDPTTDRGKVRLLIQDDTEQYNDTDIYYFTDAKIDAFLALNVDGDDPIRLAAADALDAWASNEALVTKAVKLLDVNTNGPAVAASLREHAKTLREQAAAEIGIDVAEMALGSSSILEQITNRALREG